MKNENFENKDDAIGSILRAGYKNNVAQTSAENFTHRVMQKIESAEITLVFPAFLWALPVALAAMVGIAIFTGIKSETPETTPAAIEDMLLADMPADAQNMLSHSPSFSNVLWNNNQGGLLP